MIKLAHIQQFDKQKKKKNSKLGNKVYSLMYM